MEAKDTTKRVTQSDDPYIDALAPNDRKRLGEIWKARAKSELGAGSACAIVVTELYELGARHEVIALATAASHDEVRHADLCRQLAEAYLGEPVPMPRPKRVSMPTHPGADETLVKHLHVVGLSCVNESLAVSFVEACLRGVKAPTVRPILKSHLEDEIRHARYGWAHLASLSDDERARIGAFVPRILEANVALWRSRLAELPAEDFSEHGYPPRSVLLETVDQAIRELIIPGFVAARVPLSAN